jgi:hypothetical protein
MPITRVFRDRLSARVAGAAAAYGLTQPPAVLSAGANNGTAIDATAWGGKAAALVETGAVAGTSPTVSVVIQESPDGSTGWTTVHSFTTITAANQVRSGEFNFTGPHLRSVSTVGGSATPTVATAVVLKSNVPAPLLPTTMYVGVMTAINDQGLDTDISDVTAPSGSLGTRQLVSSWSAPSDRTGGVRYVQGPMLTFRPPDAAGGAIVNGWYLADASTGGNLLAWGLFDDPVNLVDETRSVNVVFRPAVDPAALWDVTVAFNG